MIQFNNKNTDDYIIYLKSIGSLSKLFSDSDVPYLYYRIAENIFCKSYNAENLARLDIAYDAKINNIGIGLKTFKDKKTNNEKIAEFDKLSSYIKQLYNSKNNDNLIEYIVGLRNERIDFANRAYGINSSIYHCVARRKNKILLYNCDYNKIDISKVKINKIDNKSFSFNCENEEYSFNFAKSTLYKKFYVPDNILQVDITIIEDPFETIYDWYKTQEKQVVQVVFPYVYLPLYSLKNNERYVAEKSGLNQWNASGRKRDFGEVYIQIPSYIHKNHPNFFPARDVSFELEIPTGQKLSAKICQDGGKALMTNPNKALSDWLLRNVFKLKEGELLTYQKLELFNIDSVLITKIDDEKFKIDFASTNSYSDFTEEL
jgi:hypothetical protein